MDIRCSLHLFAQRYQLSNQAALLVQLADGRALLVCMHGASPDRST